MRRRCSDETKKYPLRNRNAIRSHLKGISLRLSGTTKRANQKVTPVDKKKSRPEPKKCIKSFKINSFKVNSTIPGVRHYGDNIYGEYDMVNPHQ